jgi:DNA-binding MarR family transcriptional regulator
LHRTFERILVWYVAISCLWLLGALWPVHVREPVWALAIAVDLLGGAIRYDTPGLGRSRTWDWTIEGSHFAERCQAFILIALGESVVVIGATLAGLPTLTGLELAAFIIAFVGSAALWWLYFDRSAEAGARQLGIHRTDRSALQSLDTPLTAGQLAEAVNLSLPTTTSLIDRLERAGYVKRSRDTSDHRRVVVAATDLARRRIAPVFEGLADTAQARILTGCAPAELDLIRRFLEQGERVVRAHTETLRRADGALPRARR